VGPGVVRDENLELLERGARYLFQSSVDSSDSNKNLLFVEKQFQEFARVLARRLSPPIKYEGEEFDIDYHLGNSKKLPRDNLTMLEDVLELMWNEINAEMYKSRVVSHSSMEDPLQVNLKHLRRYLKDNKLLVFSTDKNLGLCVITAEWYLTQVKNMLADECTYKHVSKAGAIVEIFTCRWRVKKVVKKYGGSLLTQQEVRYLSAPFEELGIWQSPSTSTDNDTLRSVIPNFPSILKVHKKPVKFQPIVPFTNWVGRAASKVLSKRLQTFVRKYPVILTESQDLRRQLERLTVPSGE